MSPTIPKRTSELGEDNIKNPAPRRSTSSASCELSVTSATIASSTIARNSNSSPRNCAPRGNGSAWLQTIIRFVPSLQVIVLLGIIILLLHGHQRSTYLQDRMLRYRQQESVLMLQLQQLEKHSTTLHQSVQGRLRKAGMLDASSEPVNMQSTSKELHQHVVALQQAIQQDARARIIQKYGEGPLKLVLDLKIPGEKEQSQESANNRLEILFWTSTPHATWTVLEQIGRKVWDGAVLDWGSRQTILQVTPLNTDPLHRGRLDFSENPDDHRHAAWTVGVRNDEDTGKLQLFLNLQDNAETHNHETCIGRVVGGFDVLQRLLLASRQVQDSEASPAAVIREVFAMHVTPS